MHYQLLIGKHAPAFQSPAISDGQIDNQFSLELYANKYVIFFFYPLDFTFVCPTELIAFQDKLEQFEKRNAKVVACSVDSPYSHLAWLNTPRSKGGIEGIKYPIVSDLRKTIARDYQVLDEEAGVAYRGLFIIDKTGVIRHQLINDLPIGRSVEEVLRVLDALIVYETHGEVCPANWKAGDKTMQPNQEGLKAYFN